jgi:general secretion pathway protein G
MSDETILRAKQARLLVEQVERFTSTLGRPFEALDKERGMTLLEIIIVVALVGGLMTFIIGGIAGGTRTARERETGLAFGQLRSSLQMYKLAAGRFPTTEQGLSALVEKPSDVKGWRGPYVEPELLNDAWGVAITYESDGRKIQFTSAGDDGEFGTDDDLRWPEERTGETSAADGKTERRLSGS